MSTPEMVELLKCDKKKIFTSIVEKCNNNKIKICGTDCENGCGAMQPNKYIKEGLSKIYAEWKNGLLNDIPNEDKFGDVVI